MNYKYDEREIVEDVMAYINGTYSQHYGGEVSAMDAIISIGHGLAKCLADIIKYAMRFGKKDGENEKDLMKIIHYAVIAIFILRKGRSASQ